MKQYQKMSETAATARRLQSYVETLLGCENRDAKSDDAQSCFNTDSQGMVSIIRKGDAVSFTCIGSNGHMEAGCYRRETFATSARPSLAKCYINNRDGIIELDGVRYFSPELIMRYDQNVQAVRIGDTLYIFDMCGKGVAEVKCNE